MERGRAEIDVDERERFGREFYDPEVPVVLKNVPGTALEPDELTRELDARIASFELAARMQLQGACECLPPDTDVLANVEKILGETLKKARRLSHELSPAVLHHSGLAGSLDWLSRQMKEQFGLQVKVASEGTDLFESAPLKIFLFRAVQELLFNVVKHAGVKTAQVTLSRFDRGLVLQVTDQGRGFKPDILPAASVSGWGMSHRMPRFRVTLLVAFQSSWK